MPRELTIAGRRIADDEPCYVIAELGSNHGGDVYTATDMIRMAATCGASAVKLQKKDIDTLYSPALLAQPYESEHSYGPTYGTHKHALEFGMIGFEVCQMAAEEARIPLFATAFDEVSADRLMLMGHPAIKIHSGGLTDDPLLRHVASLGVPIILSTGGGTRRQIDHAMMVLGARTTDFALLHCTASYPLNPAEANLRCIVSMRESYPNTVIGWSSHATGPALGLVAYALGARILEQHVTLNRASKGTDHAFSLESGGLRWLCEELEKAHQALGDGVKVCYPSEVGPISKMRRSNINGKWQIGTPAEQAAEVHV